ncbi:MAG: prepilin-type N-terminal cleavage/methylation domain-containing protein [Proteobacteria bacterium]|nr:prepilin-type N-terminal cleavage/methylation domain-containing protein [Pseudomonadota bacterium]
MKCVDSFFSRKGVTLVELMISVAVIGIVVLTAGHYFSESQMPNLRISNVVSGDALAREFFNLQKKRLLSSTDMVPTVFSNPVNATTFSGATISFNNVAGTGVGRVSTTCVDLPGGIAPLEDNALNEINACLPGGMRCRPDQVPVIREGGNRLFPRGAGDGRDGNPVGAAICFTLWREVWTQ